jgi:hypothetical protein
MEPLCSSTRNPTESGCYGTDARLSKLDRPSKQDPDAMDRFSNHGSAGIVVLQLSMCRGLQKLGSLTLSAV